MNTPIKTAQVIDSLSDAEEKRRGELLVSVLDLSSIGVNSSNQPLYDTQWGTKTALGLFRTVARIVIDGE